MKMKKRRLVFIICVVMMTAMAVTGCQSDEDATTKENKKEEETKPFEISIFGRYFGNSVPDMSHESFTKTEELTNTKLDIEWVPAASYGEKFFVMLASKQLPMVSYVYNRKNAPIVNAVENNAFWIAGDYVNEKEYPNLAKADPNGVEMGKVKGKKVFLNAERPLGRPVFIYRKDIAEKNGITKIPETTDELYELFKALSEDLNFGVTLNDLSPPNDQWQYSNMFAVWFGAPNNFGVEDGKIIYAPFTDGWKKSLKFMKRLYDEGICNSDFPSVSNNREMFYSGKAGAILLAASNFDHAKGNMADKNAEVEMFGKINGRACVGDGLGQSIAISKNVVKKEDDVKRIIKFFDICASPEMRGLYQHGVVGKDSEVVEVDGEKYAKVIVDRDQNYKTFGAAQQILSMRLRAVAKEQEYKLYSSQRVYDVRAENAAPGVAVFNVVTPYISNTYNEVGPQLNSIIEEASIKYIFGDITMEEYEKEMDKWLASGGSQVLEEYQEQYDKYAK